MPQDGLAYNGDFITGTPGGEDEAFDIEIPDDDPNFIIKAANKNPPSAWERFTAMFGGAIEGAYSWPFDYTLCVHWILGHAGFYGSNVQQTCFDHRDRILGVLGAGVRVIYYLIFRGLLWNLLTNETAQNLARDQLSQTDREAFDNAIRDIVPSGENTSQMAARYASGRFFTRWMQTRIVRRGGGTAHTRGIAWTNTIMLMWGSAIHASHNNPTNFGVIEIFIGWITGDSEEPVDNEAFSALYRAAQALTENADFIDSLGEDYTLYRSFVQALLDFGAAGGQN